MSLRELHYGVSAEVNAAVDTTPTTTIEAGYTPVDTTTHAVSIAIPAPTGSKAIYVVGHIAGDYDLVVAPASGKRLSPDMSEDEQIVMPLGQTITFLDHAADGMAIIAEYLPEASYPTLSAPAMQTVHKVQEVTVTFTGASGYGTITYTPSYSYPPGSSATFTQVSSLVYTITPDVEGSYVVELRLEDSRGRYITKTAVVTFQTAGAVWTVLANHDWDFRTATPATRTGAGSLNIVWGGTTLVATAYNSAGNQTFGVNATDGLYAEITSGTPQTMLTVPTTIGSTVKYAIQWLWRSPTFSNTTVAGRLTLSNATNSTSGTQILPHNTLKNSTSGLNINTTTRSAGTPATAMQVATGLADPGLMCTTVIIENRQAKWRTHAVSADFTDMADIDSGGLWDPIYAAQGDPSPGYSAQWIPNPKIGVEVGNSSGKMGVLKMRVLTATPTMG